MNWIIEENTFGEECFDRLIEAIRCNNQSYKVVDYRPFLGVDVEPCDEAVITYGSINLCKAIQKLPLYPGTFCTFSNYKCSKYYPEMGRWLLNSDYVMLPYGELLRAKDFLNRVFGDTFFVRPDTGDKCFSGQVIGGDYSKDVERLGFYDVAANTIVVVSDRQNICREWRLVVSDTVIAASLYQESGNHVETEGCPDEVREFAQDILNSTSYRPDPVWTMDVCQVGDDLKLLEIGSFSAAGLYACDMREVVSEVTKHALWAWLESQ